MEGRRFSSKMTRHIFPRLCLYDTPSLVFCREPFHGAFKSDASSEIFPLGTVSEHIRLKPCSIYLYNVSLRRFHILLVTSWILVHQPLHLIDNPPFVYQFRSSESTPQVHLHLPVTRITRKQVRSMQVEPLKANTLV